MFFACDVELSGGAPLVILDDVIWFSGVITQCSSNGHSRSIVCVSWRQPPFTRVCYSGLITRLSRDKHVVFVRAASVG